MSSKTNQWGDDQREIAELIWCAAHLHLIMAPLPSEETETAEEVLDSDDSSSTDIQENVTVNPPRTGDTDQRTPIATYSHNNEPSTSFSSDTQEFSSEQRASPVRVPDPFPLPKPSTISKGLLPLARRVSGLFKTELDIEATVEQTAEANGLLIPAFCTPKERWFEVHLLIDHSPSMAFWGDLAEGMATLFRWQGFFRDVRVWQFETKDPTPRFFSGAEGIEREVKSLIASGRQRLFIVLTDTLGKAWHSGKAFSTLGILGEQHPVAIAHIFPQTLWKRTALHQAIQRPLVAPMVGCPNSKLKVGTKLQTRGALYQFPIFNLSPQHFSTWAKFLGESGNFPIQGVLIRQENLATEIGEKPSSKRLNESSTSESLLQAFLSNASPEARKLASVLAAVPLIPPVMRLAQQQFLNDSKPWHLAEVFFSGLIQRSPLRPNEQTIPETWYEFRGNIRELLLKNTSVRQTTEVWRDIGTFIEKHYGSLRDFQALIPNPTGSISDVGLDQNFYFAEVNAAVLKTWGGEYAEYAQKLTTAVNERKWKKVENPDVLSKNKFVQLEGFPPLKILKVQVSALVFNDGTTGEQSKLSTLDFETVILNESGEEVRKQASAQYFSEKLSSGVEIDMIVIREGSFLMGSPESERGREDDESPQHQVTVASFFLGRYPVTQQQWRAIASLPVVERELPLEPSRFKGDNLPVDNITWLEAVEACQRLKQATGRDYRLPTEAEWEYACRAGTTTPFYFGTQVTPALANYEGLHPTPVGDYSPNSFGLSDMHGNVWEWCQDTYHNSYEYAPSNGRVWREMIGDVSVVDTRIQRGGSWIDSLLKARSAYRGKLGENQQAEHGGLRLACELLKVFEFETPIVNSQGIVIEGKKSSVQYFREILSQTGRLEMIYIPGGEFIMGSDENEAGRYEDEESPQHRVKVAPFYMSQTPITQSQWRAIASLPQVERELNLNPSYFEGDDNPVENIEWQDAIEWCARLSIHTGRQYRLPSEAEWEYACRGFQSPPVSLSNSEDTEAENPINTKVYPPFHFGDTITDKLANYHASTTYADEPKGEYRAKTTPVRSFNPNAFGLYDLHGNVWEWCLEPWHSDYNGAPNDGRVWDDENQQEDFYQDIVKNIKQLLTDKRSHVIRGGSYFSYPRGCRSAVRIDLIAGDNLFGFRVVCVPPRSS